MEEYGPGPEYLAAFGASDGDLAGEIVAAAAQGVRRYALTEQAAGQEQRS